MTHPAVHQVLDDTRAVVWHDPNETDCQECSKMRNALAERDEYIAELERRLASAAERANAAEVSHAATRRRAGLDAESLSRMLMGSV